MGTTKSRTGNEYWKEYFDKLLHTEEQMELIKIGNRDINECEVEELTIEDVNRQWET